ncbi:MAG: hypothetical protein MJZ05_03480 [Fibrobacter sp.]|nr:hypothetical protein [Fibrobacter sp.]
MKSTKCMAITALAVLGVFGACGDDNNSVNPGNDDLGYSSEAGVADESSSSNVADVGLSSSSVAGITDIPNSSSAVFSSSATASSSSVIASSSSEGVLSSSSSEVIQAAPAFKEDYRSECSIGEIPTSINNAKLPDPFKTLAGTRISTKDEWKCRREEIGAMYEKIMYGDKPRNPEKVEGKLAGSTFTVTVTDKGKSASFAVNISGAGTKDNPKPAMIGFGGGFMGNTCGSLGGALTGLDIAQIIFNPDNVAPESNRGSGKFYDIYGSNASAGTIMAWAWGVSRLIDALEKTPEAGIDVKHLGITGCSRWGKGSLAAGAFDSRIALVIPQESGSGGASLWRVGAQVNKQKGKQFVQGLNSAGSEGNWMKTTFKNYDGRENTLPFDQHMLVAMVAPRPLLIIDNAGQEWLGEVPSNYCGQASKEVFDALGVSENYTYSQEGAHAHCSLPNGQFDEVKDFINKFLVGKDGIKTGKIDYTKNSEQIKWNKSDWIDWETPTLK